MNRSIVAFFAVSLLMVQSSKAVLTPEQIKSLPPPASHPINFESEIKPIFEASCIRCHGRGRVKAGFQIDSRESLLKGGDTGPGAVSGKSDTSYLIEVVSGLNADEVMPKKGKKLTPEEVGLLRAWVDQGLPWPAEIGFGPIPPQNLDPRSPEIPEAQHEPNPLDRFLDVYFEQHHIDPPQVVDDRIFARRVYLDTIGLLPPADELKDFVSSRRPGKRIVLVNTLLQRNEPYAKNWMTFWNDLLRNDYQGTGFVDGGREQITRWLYSALLTNMSYDRFVTALICPKEESQGFSKGIVWRGVVNASQMPQMQEAQNVSQVLMGINLKCASCHDSFINDWQLSDAYGLANVFSDQPLEIYRCDVPTGQQAAIKFLFPQLGELPVTTNKVERVRALAKIVTGPKDGRLPRTIVNRLWAKFLGRGLVEPVDDMQQNAWNRDMLDWLAQDLVEHDYDLKETMASILTSRAYQLPAVDLGESHQTNFVFTGPEIRRMTAEQFRDALTSLTGAGYASPDAEVELDESIKQKFGPKLEAHWIWTPAAPQASNGSVIYLRKTVQIETEPSDAAALVYGDDGFEMFVNGHKVGTGADREKPFVLDLSVWLKAGDNVIAMHSTNTPVTPPNPTGLFVYARVRANPRGKERIMDFVSDRSWMVTTNQQTNGWEQPDFDARDWVAAKNFGPGGAEPWKLPEDDVARQFSKRAEHDVRAALVTADPLLVAMGRPDREQVVTTRPTAATTLQALELSNGKTLATAIDKGAANLMQQNENGTDLVRTIYLEAMGRSPSRNEMRLAEGVVGNKPTQDGVEDFLWAVTMLPEFQLIY